MPRGYNPDHTIEIRRRLWSLVVSGAVGLLLAGTAVGITAIAAVSSDGEAAGASRVA